MPQMNMIQALNAAMDIALGLDPAVVVLGEDVGYFGGVFRVTDGSCAMQMSIAALSAWIMLSCATLVSPARAGAARAPRRGAAAAP